MCVCVCVFSITLPKLWNVSGSSGGSVLIVYSRSSESKVMRTKLHNYLLLCLYQCCVCAAYNMCLHGWLRAEIGANVEGKAGAK